MSAPETSELTVLLLASSSSGPVMFVGWMHLGKRIILEVFGYVHNLRYYSSTRITMFLLLVIFLLSLHSSFGV